MIQQRAYTRWILNKRVRIRCPDFGPRSVDCLLGDLSFKGAKISTAAKFPKDRFVQISILISDHFILSLEAWIVWHQAIDGINSYGLYFSKMHDHDKERIYRFICENYNDQLNEKWWGKAPQQEQEKEAGMEDRRIFQRFAVKKPVRLLDVSNGQEDHAQSFDISAKGIGLELNSMIKPHSALEMWLEASGAQEPVYARGEVVWSKPADTGGFRAGVNLEKADLFSLARLLR